MDPGQSGTVKIARAASICLLVVCIIANAPWPSSSRADRPHASRLALATRPSRFSVSPLNTEPIEPLYGMHGVFEGDLGTVSDLGTQVVLMSFRHDGTPAEWLAYLNAAQAQQIRVIAWLWPEGWTWDGAAWQIDAQVELFVQTVSTHPALFAVYALHEPYWNGCIGCGYTTTEQQALYSAIKAIADVPIHSAVDSMSAWTQYAEEYHVDTAFADGICDYCETWYHPFREYGTYERETLIAHVEADLAVARERAPNSKIVWSMQSFAQEVPLADDYRMPTAEEMRDLALIVYSRGVDGALWYPWDFEGGLYSDFLSNHPELYPVVREIYDEIVMFPYRIHLPLVLSRDLSALPAPASAERAEGSLSARLPEDPAV